MVHIGHPQCVVWCYVSKTIVSLHLQPGIHSLLEIYMTYMDDCKNITLYDIRQNCTCKDMQTNGTLDNILYKSFEYNARKFSTTYTKYMVVHNPLSFYNNDFNNGYLIHRL